MARRTTVEAGDFIDHTLTGTFHVSNALDAEAKAIQAARDYFGDIPVFVTVQVSEMRDIADRVMTYEVDYTAVPGHRETAPR